MLHSETTEKRFVYGKCTLGNSFLHIKNIVYVEGLKLNLFRISQLCDNGPNVNFEPK